MRAEVRRRTLLRAVAAGGVVGAAGGHASASRATANRSAGASGWPMFGHNPANTGHAPTESGPTTSVTQQWRFQTEDRVSSSPAVVDDAVYVGSFDTHVYALASGSATATAASESPTEDESTASGATALGGTTSSAGDEQGAWLSGWRALVAWVGGVAVGARSCWAPWSGCTPG